MSLDLSRRDPGNIVKLRCVQPTDGFSCPVLSHRSTLKSSKQSGSRWAAAVVPSERGLSARLAVIERRRRVYGLTVSLHLHLAPVCASPSPDATSTEHCGPTGIAALEVVTICKPLFLFSRTRLILLSTHNIFNMRIIFNWRLQIHP